MFRSKRSELDTSMMYSGKVITLYPTEEQKKYLDKCIELYRFVYNWTIEQKEQQYELSKLDDSISSYLDQSILQTRLSELRNNNPWLQEVPLGTLRNAMFDAIESYNKFFDKRYNNYKPKFKSKKRSKKQFAPRLDGKFYFEDNLVRIEGLPIGDKIETKWYSGYHKSDNIKFINVRVSIDTTGKYKLSFNTPIKKPCYEGLSNEEIDNYKYTPKYNRAIGIDLNVKNLIVTSYNEGEIYKAPDISTDIRRLKRLQRKCQKDRNNYKQQIKELERTNPDCKDLPDKSNNAKKRQIKLAQIYKNIHNKYDTYIRTIAKNVVTRFPQAIVMEDLNVENILSDHYMAKNFGFYTPLRKIREIFEWNCSKYDVPFLLADKEYPSSQICHVCGSIKKMGTQKTYICPVCGYRGNRDINASFNLENLWYSYI